MKPPRGLAGVLLRAGITAFAFWWIFRLVDQNALAHTLRGADLAWLVASAAVFFLSQLGCVVRWHLLAPKHPAVTWPFLANSFFVASFFNTFLPTTVGGDVVRGYDLIKTTGEWRPALASVLADRLIGMVGFVSFAGAAFFLFPPARQDPVIRWAFLGFCAVVLAAFAVLGSRRVLTAMLKPFSKIGLGALSSHAAQFQEALLSYLQQPGRLAAAFGVTLILQTLAILLYACVSKALGLGVPLLFFVLAVPIVITISQVPVSLNGWGIREGATVLIFSRVQVAAAQALSLSLICAVIPILSAVVGAGLFLARRRRKKG